jgi:hypothetical protein
MRSLSVAAVVTGPDGSWRLVALALCAAALSSLAWRRLRGTTLAAAAAWAIVSATTIAAVEAAVAWRADALDPLTVSLARYAAAVGTFCPLMAVLGAKRPQHRGWQWIVLSLWVVMLVPVMQAMAARSGNRLELFAAWRLLIAALIAMGLLNYLPTRYAAAGALLAVGQTLLVGPFLLQAADRLQWREGGVAVILAATSLAYVQSSRRPASASPGQREHTLLGRCNERWFAMRDGWGAFWGLRVLQRVNQTAELSRWPVRLRWREGFAARSTGDAGGGSAVDAPTAAHIHQTMDSLLRRFERLETPAALPQATHESPRPRPGRG